MTFLVATGSFTTGTGTTQIDVTATDANGGGTFQPKVVLLAMTSATALNTTTSHSRLSIGAFSGATARWCTTFIDADSGSTGVTSRATYQTACLASYDTAPAIDGLLDVVSMNSDGFSLVPDNAFPASYQVIYLALGGTDITAAEAGTFQRGTGTGNLEVNLAGAFQPTVVLFSGGQSSALDTAATEGKIGFGWTTGAAQASCSIGGDNGPTTTLTAGATTTSSCLVTFNNALTTFGEDNAYVSFDADGFTVNKVTASNVYIGYVAIAGIQAYAGTTVSEVGTGTLAVTAPGFQAKAVLVMQTGNPTATETAPSAHAQFSLGWAVAAGGYGVYATSQSGLADSDSMSRTSATVPIQKHTYSVANTWLDTGTADIDSLDATGFTRDQLATDVQATLIPYLVLGAAAGGTAGTWGNKLKRPSKATSRLTGF